MPLKFRKIPGPNLDAKPKHDTNGSVGFWACVRSGKSRSLGFWINPDWSRSNFSFTEKILEMRFAQFFALIKTWYWVLI